MSGGELQINKQEILLYRQFQALFNSDDSLGKVKCWKELAYIYFMYDVDSDLYQNLANEGKRHTEALHEAALDENYELSTLVNDAATKYKDLQKTPSIRLLEQVRKTLISTTDVYEFLNNNLTRKLILLQDMEDTIDMNDPVAYKDFTLLSDQIFKDIARVQTLSKEIPNLIEKTEELTNKVRAEISDKKIAAGGRMTGNREDPDYIAKFSKSPIELRNKDQEGNTNPQPVQESKPRQFVVTREGKGQ